MRASGSVLLRRFSLRESVFIRRQFVRRPSGTYDFSTLGGTISGNASGLSLNAPLTQVKGLYGGGVMQGTNLGSVTITTGALSSGSLGGPATFAAGGTFTITGNGVNGVPNGVIFSGTFSQPVQWLVSTGTNNSGKTVYDYTLEGVVTGKLSNGYQTVAFVFSADLRHKCTVQRGFAQRFERRYHGSCPGARNLEPAWDWLDRPGGTCSAQAEPGLSTDNKATPEYKKARCEERRVFSCPQTECQFSVLEPNMPRSDSRPWAPFGCLTAWAQILVGISRTPVSKERHAWVAPPRIPTRRGVRPEPSLRRRRRRSWV